VCILKNDHLCKYMGFTLTKQEQERRKAALEKYSNL
jgi:predicted phosphoadenosine phosphosulfate sulfurtransferase